MDAALFRHFSVFDPIVAFVHVIWIPSDTEDEKDIPFVDAVEVVDPAFMVAKPENVVAVNVQLLNCAVPLFVNWIFGGVAPLRPNDVLLPALFEPM